MGQSVCKLLNLGTEEEGKEKSNDFDIAVQLIFFHSPPT